ncbi:MAG: HAMP domain-containing histidine kinase [Planctomycetes bacterium]|nr:HAMP domain-containing histidine kinase [Planctomycetota bacterium]
MTRRGWELHARLSLAFGGLMALVVGALVLVWLWSSATYDRELRQQLNRDVARHLAEHSVPLGAEGVDRDELGAMLMHVMSVNPALEVYLLDDAGAILAYDAPEGHVRMSHVDLAPVAAALRGEAAGELGDDPRAPGTRSPISVWPLEEGGARRGYVYVVIGGEAWRATAGPLRGVRERTVIAAAGAGLLLVGLAAGVFFARRLTRPLRELHAAIGAERTSLPPSLRERDDELGDLARTYERMAKRIHEQVQRLERADEERREFVASVSHDLRTPLASLQGYLELLEEGEGLEPAARAQYLHVARRRSQHLARLVSQLFELARLEAGDVRPRPESFNLGELTQDVLQGLRPRATRRGVRLVCRMPRELPEVVADLGLMERALSNLLDNALKFTPTGGEVRVQLARARGGVRWSVQDDGPGIPAAELPHVFESRFRGRGRDLAPGTGLGLAITRRVLELHDSAVAVRSEEGAGCTFHFVLGGAERDGNSSAA